MAVSDPIVAAFTAGFFVLFLGPVLYFVWMSVQDDTHSPAAQDESAAAAD